MSTQAEINYSDDEVSEQAVSDYLSRNPDFFENQPALLSSLHLPHSTGGAVSLVEKQVSVLRQKELKLERQLKDLISVARANDLLAAKIHELTLQLLATDDLNSTIIALEVAMRSGFGADQAVLVLFGDPESFSDISADRFFRVVKNDAEELGPFKTYLDGRSARCGQIRDSQRTFLFQDEADEVGSAALVPLTADSNIGFLAVGSADAEHFHPGMSVDFLTRLGELIAGALRRY